MREHHEKTMGFLERDGIGTQLEIEQDNAEDDLLASQLEMQNLSNLYSEARLRNDSKYMNRQRKEGVKERGGIKRRESNLWDDDD